MPESLTQCDLDAKLLNRIQSSIPLTPTPFASLAKELGIDESTCIDRLHVLRHDLNYIRQISPIFDTHALGYQSSLVAAKVSPEKIDHAVQVNQVLGRANVWIAHPRLKFRPSIHVCFHELQ